MTAELSADRPWIRVLDAGDVPPGSVRGVKVADARIALVNLDGELCALDNACPHRGGPLARGRLVSGELECPWHRFRFDPRSGQATMPANQHAVTGHRVRVVDGGIEIAVGGRKEGEAVLGARPDGGGMRGR